MIREYSLLYEAALNAGFQEQSVAKWLRNVQRTGMEAVHGAMETTKDMAENLRKLLEATCGAQSNEGKKLEYYIAALEKQAI